MGDWVFIGDAHLREWKFDEQNRIIRFLEREKVSLETLVILGDLFEFWFGFEPLAFQGYQPVLDKLEELVKDGVHIRYVEGNHDFELGAFFTETLNATIDVNDSIIELNGQRIYMAHGDLVNKKDRGYRIFRRMLKNPVTFWTMRWAGPAVTKRVAAFLSSISAGKGLTKNAEGIGQTYREFATEKIREGFDVVILAHNHLPQSCSFEIDGKEGHYFNVGDWVDHFSFLRYRANQGFGIEYFKDQDKGERQKARS